MIFSNSSCLSLIPRVRTSNMLFETMFDIHMNNLGIVRGILKPDVEEALSLAYH